MEIARLNAMCTAITSKQRLKPGAHGAVASGDGTAELVGIYRYCAVGVAVRTWVPAEPRKKVELWWIRGALRRVDRTSFVAVQATVVMLMLLFTFARSESPLALAFTGENAFNADKQMQVKDVRVVSKVVHVRLKGIKQDPRMQRPEAAGNEDWIVIGDVPELWRPEAS